MADGFAVDPPYRVDDTAIAEVVSAALAGQAGTFGVAVRDLDTGQSYSLNSDAFFPSASLFKLAIMAEVFRQQAQGSISLDQKLTIQPSEAVESTDDDPLSTGDELTVQQLLQAMIDQSSNAAAYALADRAGWEQVNDTMATLGFDHTRLPVGAWQAQMTDWRHDDASTSAGDMLAFFDQLSRRQLISPAASDQMLQLLLNQHINDRIPADLPAGTKVAHKTGNLEGIVNDAGIVYAPNTTFVVVMLSQDADDGNVTTAEAQLARGLYDLFNQGS